ncbi:MAG: polyprenyl synthetase family protein [Planctomycetota bacterium]
MTGSAQAAVDLSSVTTPVSAVEAYMRSFIKARPMPEHLAEAVLYALMGGGKRVRPTLVVRSCEAVGGSVDDAMPAAAAIEMVHAFSLVHDDLPAMDDDDLRRGRPTLHKHTNEAMAILAGDMLLSLAFELVATRLKESTLVATVTRELATATNDMIIGQVCDTLPEWDDAVEPIERLEVIHRHKTAALLRAACRMGAVCGGASAAQLDALTQYADAMGLMFQVVDDLLDVTQSTEHLGKTAGKDIEQDKLTYPAVLGVDATKQEVERLRIVATTSLEPLGEKAEPLVAFAQSMAVRTK